MAHHAEGRKRLRQPLREMSKARGHAPSTSCRIDILGLALAVRLVGIDLMGPFPKAANQLKYLVVAIDYSTK